MLYLSICFYILPLFFSILALFLSGLSLYIKVAVMGDGLKSVQPSKKRNPSVINHYREGQGIL